MYIYKITDAETGETIIEGTEEELAESGRYKSREVVSVAYRAWVRRIESGGISKVHWERTESYSGGRVVQVKHPKRSTSREQRAASRAWQDSVAADAANKRPSGYTTERLGDIGAFPEHKAKFAQPPIEPQGTDVSPLRRDVYALEFLNWQRRKEGKRALNYGEWRAGIR